MVKKPTIVKWYFVRMDTGKPVEKPVEKDLVNSILKIINNGGSIDSLEMNIGISGKAYQSDGNKVEIDGLRNKVARISEKDGELLITTANCNEYIADRKSMIKAQQARANIEKEQEKLTKNARKQLKNYGGLVAI